jgi:hypothetical protein
MISYILECADRADYAVGTPPPAHPFLLIHLSNSDAEHCAPPFFAEDSVKQGAGLYARPSGVSTR